MPKSESLFAYSLFFKDQLEQFAPVALDKSNCERFAQAAHDKRETMSDSLRSLMTKYRQDSLFCSFAHKKTRESLKKPMSEFRTLSATNVFWFKVIGQGTYECIHKP